MSAVEETSKSAEGRKQTEALARAEKLEREAALIRAEAGLEPLTVFPALAGAPGGFHFDRATKTFWTGFDVMRIDYQGAKDFLRSADFQIWSLYQEIMKQVRARDALHAPAGSALERMASAAKAKLGLR